MAEIPVSAFEENGEDNAGRGELGRSVACMFPEDATSEGKALLLAATLMIKSTYLDEHDWYMDE